MNLHQSYIVEYQNSSLYKTGIDESTLEHFKNLFIYEF